MPIYNYACAGCGTRDQRVGGLDDHTAICTACGDLMLRLDEDIFAPYFEEQTRTDAAQATFKIGLAAARQTLEDLP